MDASNTRKAAGHIAGLDLLRFFAALAVAFYHLTVTIVAPSDSGVILGDRARYPELYQFAWPGFIGVEVFFLISGAVISYSAMKQSPWRFLQSRALRLYPAAWVCVSISTVVYCALHIFPAGELLRRWFGSMLLIPMWPSIDSVSWTLGVEMVFYVAVFSLLSILSAKYLYGFGVAIGLASMFYLLAGIVLWPEFMVNDLFKWMSLSLMPYGIYFGLGIVLFLRQGRLSLLDIAFIGAALAASYIEISMKTVVNHATFHAPQVPIVPALVFLAALGFTILSFRLPVPPAVARTFRTLGLATYPLYLLHDVTGAAIIRWLVDAGLGRGEALGFSLAIVVAMSIAISQWIEPAIRSRLAVCLAAAQAAAAPYRAGATPTP